jgi:hypothetical protein
MQTTTSKVRSARSVTVFHDCRPSNKENNIRKERQEMQTTTLGVHSARSATLLETRPHAS